VKKAEVKVRVKNKIIQNGFWRCAVPKASGARVGAARGARSQHPFWILVVS
jgi:hypothetical protein